MARTIELKDIIMTAFNNFEANKLCAEIVLKDDYHTVKINKVSDDQKVFVEISEQELQI